MICSPVFLKRLSIALSFVLLIAASVSIARAAGEVDPTFNGGVIQQPNRNAFVLKRQADGKILVGGDFETANGTLDYSIARVNADGSPDTTFHPPDTLLGTVRAIAVQPDGKILIGGNFLIPLLTNWTYVARLNVDGSFDNSFATITTTQDSTGSNLVRDIEIAADGKIFIAGNFAYNPPSGGLKTKIARLNANGTTDTAFSPLGQFTDINDIEIQTDGKIVGVTTDGGNGSRFIKRFNTDGSEDLSFNTLVTGSVNALKILADGKILIGGGFNFVNNIARIDAARLNTDGTLDTSFNITSNGAVNDIDTDAGGGILLGGTFTTFNGTARRYIARTDANGNTDTSFADVLPQFQFVYVILPTPDGKVISSVASVELANSGRTVIRQNANGTIDNSFAVKIGTRGLVTKIAVQPDGKILVAGYFGALNSFTCRQLCRFNADGTPDTAFNPNPFPNAIILSIAVQPDGKILVSEQEPSSAALYRLNADGSYDTGFTAFTGPGRFVNDIAVQPDGKILIIGGDNNFRFVRRFNPDGTPDNTLTTTTTGAGSRIILQPDGKILIAGDFTAVNGTPRGRVARLNADGSLDSTFNPLGGANNTVNDIALQSDGKIVIGGSFLSYNGSGRNYLARLNTDGNLDGSFTIGTDNTVRAIRIEPNGKIIIGGDFTMAGGTPRNAIARISPDGMLDSSFNIGTGVAGNVYALALQADSKILVGGNFIKFNNVPKLSIVRLLNNAARALYDFDGDGKAEVSVFRPSSGYWYELRSQNSGFYALQFGASSDLIAPADYDGDGKTDIAVWRGVVPGAGNFAYFYIYRSSDNVFVPVQFGATGDVPISGDFDGDGKADLAVYRDGSQTGGQSYFFYRPTSAPAENYRTIVWGGTGDKPLYGDFDGDGKLDAAIFRPSSGQWFILRSSDNQVVNVAFGVSGDIPVPADYDGDGRANIAVFRPSNGTWYTSQNPATNYGAVLFGQTGDLPVPADYDGDGKADVAVFRPSSGAWYQLRSTQGFTGVAFGDANDKPIPNAYIR